MIGLLEQNSNVKQKKKKKKIGNWKVKQVEVFLKRLFANTCFKA